MAGLMVAIANSISSNYVASAGGGYDPDAEAFIIATGISGSNANAINELVLDLKGANIWTKFNALYPIIGTTATQQKFNLKNPADTNAAFRLSFSGGWTHSANGALPNGTNAYADTFFNTSTNFGVTNNHVSYYSRTQDTTLNRVEVGNYNGTVAVFLAQYTPTVNYYKYYSDYQTPTYMATVNNSNTLGFQIGTRVASNNLRLHFNGSLVATNSASRPATAHSNLSLYLGAANYSTKYYSNRECAFASIGSGLTDTESQLFYQIVEKYQVALGRNINPLQSFYYNRNYNNEANAYLFSTQITDTTQQVALNTLVSDMKTYGIWSKMKAVYPIMGTTATQQKFNLVDTQDTNAAYRLTFAGGWTHSSTGMTPNGTNAYANTNFNVNLLQQNSSHFSYYSRTNSQSGHDAGAIEIGTPFYKRFEFLIRYTDNNSYNSLMMQSAQTAVAVTDSRAFWLMSRTNSTQIKQYKNNSLWATNNQTSVAPFNALIYLGQSNGQTGFYSNKEVAFASIGDGLTDAEAANFYTAIQNFQTSLGRSVGPQTVSDPDAQAFINAANIQDQVEATAINNLVIGLKADGLWTAMKAIYPMVGGSATSNAVNLKTPGTYNLTFNGGWTHSATGATPNGTNAYANTNLIPSTALLLNSTHISYYSRTNVNLNQVEIGNQSSLAYLVIQARVSNLSYFLTYTNTITSAADTNSAAFYIGNRTASNVTNGFRNNVKIFNSTLASTSRTTNSIYIGAMQNLSNVASLYSNKECAFASIGDGLTDTQAANLYTRVQTFNTTLNRQV